MIWVNDLGLLSYWCTTVGCCGPCPTLDVAIWYCMVLFCISVPFAYGFHSLFLNLGLDMFIYSCIKYENDENESVISCAVSW